MVLPPSMFPLPAGYGIIHYFLQGFIAACNSVAPSSETAGPDMVKSDYHYSYSICSHFLQPEHRGQTGRQRVFSIILAKTTADIFRYKNSRIGYFNLIRDGFALSLCFVFLWGFLLDVEQMSQVFFKVCKTYNLLSITFYTAQ